MIVLISKNTLQEGKEQDFVQIAEKMAEETQKEEGCCFYRLAKDAQAENIYYLKKKKKRVYRCLSFFKNCTFIDCI